VRLRFETRARGSRAWFSVLGAALAACLLAGSGDAAAQPKPAPAPAKASPADKPAAKAADKDKGGDATAKPAGSAAPSAGEAPPAASSALPPGHPALDEEDADDDGPGAAQAGQCPHGGGRPNVPGMFNAPPDTADDDPSLPPGTIVVTVKDGQNKPIARAPLDLGVLRNTVARGEAPPEHVTRTTDDEGTVRFDGQPIGAGASFRVSTERSSATYEAPPFALGDKAGKRVTLHAYEVTSNIDKAMVGVQGVVYVQLHEDSISVQQYLGVVNVGGVAWAPDDVVIALPEGFRAFNQQDSMDDGRVDEVPKKGVALRGTFGPGQHDLEFHYTVPLDGTERQTLHFALPPHLAQMHVMVEASKKMGLEVPGFPAARRQTGRDGKKLLITERQASRAEGGLASVDVTLTGLPTQGPGRWISVALGLALVGAGVAYAARRRGGAVDDDARRDLREAQTALLDEIVALERAHASGEVGPKTYGRVRAALLDSLARITSMLDEARESQRARRRHGHGQGAASAGA
jgi:hypothetical protein